MKYIFGNWKLNGSLKEIDKFEKEFSASQMPKNVKFGLAVPFVYLQKMSQIFEKKCEIGAENVSFANSGEFTGEISATMLEDVKAKFCLVGHSERRHKFGETNEIVNQKLLNLQQTKLKTILCIGETKDEFEQKKTKQVLKSQLQKGLKNASAKNLIVAYEPVWAIGTGLTPTAKIVEDTVLYIKKVLNQIFGENKILVLYGGSVKPENANQLLKSKFVDGALVGGASLCAKKFVEIGKNSI